MDRDAPPTFPRAPVPAAPNTRVVEQCEVVVRRRALNSSREDVFPRENETDDFSHRARTCSAAGAVYKIDGVKGKVKEDDGTDAARKIEPTRGRICRDHSTRLAGGKEGKLRVTDPRWHRSVQGRDRIARLT